MLDVEELLELEDNIRKELDDHLPAALSMLNRTGELETFLKMLGIPQSAAGLHATPKMFCSACRMPVKPCS